MGGDTYYDTLGVSRSATPQEIKVRYRRLILRIHPDLDGPPALFRQVQEAYEVLSDPFRRASYDRSLEAQGAAARTRPPATAAQQPRRRNPVGRGAFGALLSRHPAATVGIAGAILLLFGVALTEIGTALILLGAAALVTAGVAGLGGRGVKESEAYQRSGMKAVDAMTERQFEVLLEHFFAKKGYRVARIGGRGGSGADLLLNDASGRTIVQARRWNSLVPRDAVQQAVAARARYGAARALVVTSSDYSEDALTVASSSGVTLWNRADLAAELTVLRRRRLPSGTERFSSELRAGSRMCAGFLMVAFVALVAARIQERRLPSGQRFDG
jgi:curved DNA-binding protein CbpA